MENAMDVYKRILMQMTWVIFFLKSTYNICKKLPSTHVDPIFLPTFPNKYIYTHTYICMYPPSHSSLWGSYIYLFIYYINFNEPTLFLCSYIGGQINDRE